MKGWIYQLNAPASNTLHKFAKFFEKPFKRNVYHNDIDHRLYLLAEIGWNFYDKFTNENGTEKY